MLNKCFFLIVCLMAASGISYSQNNPAAYFAFDDCTVTDASDNYSDGQLVGSVDCICGPGVNSSALSFDGQGDTMIMDQGLKDLFLGDFSISFYLWMDNVSDITSIMSVQGDCSVARDSAFFIRYFPNSNELVMELSKNFGEIVTLRALLDENLCWNHVLITREGQVYSLYLNGIFVYQYIFFDQVVLGEDYPFLVGVTACSGTTDQFFNGAIDELRFFDYALKSETEIDMEQLFPDQILTADTTIFEGSTILLMTAESCANNVSWTPSGSLNNASSAEPEASPVETTLYTVSFNYGSCISTDEITVSVLSEDEIACGNILLPKAFTPNNDGINERFRISNSFIIEDLERFEIYDKWGLKLFETFDKNSGWDGMYKGQPMPPGTYVFKLEYSCMGQLFRRTSTFNVLK